MENYIELMKWENLIYLVITGALKKLKCKNKLTFQYEKIQIKKIMKFFKV